jgi:hypothetical protein
MFFGGQKKETESEAPLGVTESHLKATVKLTLCISIITCRGVWGEVNFVRPHPGSRCLWVLQALHSRGRASSCYETSNRESWLRRSVFFCVREVISSQFGWDTDYSNRRIWNIPSVTAGKFLNLTSKYRFRFTLSYKKKIVNTLKMWQSLVTQEQKCSFR